VWEVFLILCLVFGVYLWAVTVGVLIVVAVEGIGFDYFGSSIIVGTGIGCSGLVMIVDTGVGTCTSGNGSLGIPIPL